VAAAYAILHPIKLSSPFFSASEPTTNRPAQNTQQNDSKSKLKPNRSTKIDHDKLNSVTPRVGEHFGSTLNQIQYRLLPGGKKFGRVPETQAEQQ